MTRINVAHDWLTDPDRRSRYDQIRSRTAAAHDTRAPTRTTPSPRRASPASSQGASDNQVETIQAVFRKLELADRPFTYARTRVPIVWIGAAALYTAIFAGGAVGLTLDVTSGGRAFGESAGILLILVVATLAGVAMLVGFAYFYYVAARLQRRRDRVNRSR